MKGLTAPLWPIHFKPLPDELLSSWLVRLAHAHGLKIQTFCTLIFGNKIQIFNRDIDRLAPEWLLAELGDRTGTGHEEILKTTLRSYMGWIFPHMRTSGTLQWITSLKLHHRKFKGNGLQFCPQCLENDSEPYFRKRWRVAFNTICPQHNCMLHDRCQSCGSAIAFHRIGTGTKSFMSDSSLRICHHCGFNLGLSQAQEIITYSDEIRHWLYKQSTLLTGVSKPEYSREIELLTVMHQLSMLTTSRYKSVQLHGFICDQLHISESKFTGKMGAIEIKPISDRHHLIQLVGWLMSNLELRLNLSWRSKAVRYNHLKKDFEGAPNWYLLMISQFSNWRLR